ncbi:MAG: hypothetical protein KF812_12070 [Fimbriimonadaceae bacterium]|nr:hypothetical protein [Fimbriimonadaceae bacterium]
MPKALVVFQVEQFMPVEFRFFSGSLKTFPASVNVSIPSGSHYKKLTTGKYTTDTEAKILIVELNNQSDPPEYEETAVVVRQNSVIRIQESQAVEIKNYLDLEIGYMVCLCLSQLELIPNRSRPNSVMETESVAFVGGRRRIRIRNRQLGAHGTVFSLSAPGTNNVSVACLHGDIDFPNGPLPVGSDPEIDIGTETRVSINSKLATDLTLFSSVAPDPII